MRRRTRVGEFQDCDSRKCNRFDLPVMVCMDGWVLTHSYERVEFLDQEAVDDFLTPFKPENYLDTAHLKTWGSYAESDVLMEFKYAIHKAMSEGKSCIRKIMNEFAALTGRDYGGIVEACRTGDAEVILVAMGSMAGTIKDTVSVPHESTRFESMTRLSRHPRSIIRIPSRR